MLTPSASSLEVIANKDNAYQVCFTDPAQGSASAEYIFNKKVAIIYNNADAYSTGIHDKFVEEAESRGLEIVSDEAFSDDSATDFSVQVAAAKDAEADLVQAVIGTPGKRHELAVLLDSDTDEGRPQGRERTAHGGENVVVGELVERGQLVVEGGSGMVEVGGALGPQRRNRPHELGRQVLSHGVQKPRVVARERARGGPADYDQGDDVAAEPHRQTYCAREGRQHRGIHAAALAGLLVGNETG